MSSAEIFTQHPSMLNVKARSTMMPAFSTVVCGYRHFIKLHVFNILHDLSSTGSSKLLSLTTNHHYSRLKEIQKCLFRCAKDYVKISDLSLLTVNLWFDAVGDSPTHHFAKSYK